MDITPSGRISRAEAVVRQQRSDLIGGEVLVVTGGQVDAGGDWVSADDFRDLRYELDRLQRVVMGQPEARP